MREGIVGRLVSHAHMLGTHLLGWLLRRGMPSTVGVGTLWGLLLQGVLLCAQMHLLLMDRRPPWLAVAPRLTVHECLVLLTAGVFPLLLLLQQWNASLGYLLTNGRAAHFVSARSSAQVLVESPQEVANVRVTQLLQAKAQTLEEAEEQLALLSSAVVQLEDRVAAMAAETASQGSAQPGEAGGAAETSEKSAGAEPSDSAAVDAAAEVSERPN